MDEGTIEFVSRIKSTIILLIMIRADFSNVR